MPDTISFCIEAYFGFEVTTSQCSQKRKGKTGHSDQTIIRMMSHIKTLARWIHKLKPFALGSSMTKLKVMPVGSGLKTKQAIIPTERRQILDKVMTYHH